MLQRFHIPAGNLQVWCWVPRIRLMLWNVHVQVMLCMYHGFFKFMAMTEPWLDILITFISSVTCGWIMWTVIKPILLTCCGWIDNAYVWKWICPLNTMAADGYCLHFMHPDINPYISACVWPLCICPFNSLGLRQNGRHFADNIFNRIFLNENVWIPIKISLKFVPKGPINNITALVQIMAWRCPGDKPLSESMMLVYWRIYASPGLNELNWHHHSYSWRIVDIGIKYGIMMHSTMKPLRIQNGQAPSCGTFHWTFSW